MKRVVVTPEELVTAMTVWLRVMPNRIWREVEKYELQKLQRRQYHEDEPDPKVAVAAYLGEYFQRTKWEISHPEPQAPKSPPAFKGDS